MENWQKLLLAIVICQLAGIIGTIFTLSAIPTWYNELAKPSFSPPNWLFGPVWTLLYTLMGVAAYWIYNKDKNALKVFGAQLALNTIWSIVFFGIHSTLGGLVIIILLWFAIGLTIIKFYSIDKKAAIILMPYILWVSFASILNYYLFILN